MHVSSQLHLTEVFVSDSWTLSALNFLSTEQHNLMDTASLRCLSSLANLLKCFKPHSKFVYFLLKKNGMKLKKSLPLGLWYYFKL